MGLTGPPGADGMKVRCLMCSNGDTNIMSAKQLYYNDWRYMYGVVEVKQLAIAITCVLNKSIEYFFNCVTIILYCLFLRVFVVLWECLVHLL